MYDGRFKSFKLHFKSFKRQQFVSRSFQKVSRDIKSFSNVSRVSRALLVLRNVKIGLKCVLCLTNVRHAFQEFQEMTMEVSRDIKSFKSTF